MNPSLSQTTSTDIQKLQLWGVKSGTSFDQFYNSTTAQLRSVTLKYGLYLNSLQLFISDGTNSLTTNAVGGSSGTSATWQVPTG